MNPTGVLFNRGTDRRAAQPQADAPIEAQAAESAEGDTHTLSPPLTLPPPPGVPSLTGSSGSAMLKKIAEFRDDQVALGARLAVPRRSRRYPLGNLLVVGSSGVRLPVV